MPNFASLAKKKKAKNLLKKTFWFQYRNIILLVLVAVFCQLIDSLFVYNFAYVKNDRFLLGIFQDNSLAVLLSLFGLLVWFFVARVQKNILYVLISGAVISNILDRIIWNGVIDYLNFFNLFYFNFADIIIVTAISIIIIHLFFPRLTNQKNVKNLETTR